MQLRNALTRRIGISLWAGMVSAACWTCATFPARAQGEAQAEPQEEQTARISIGPGLLEITARNETDTARAISVGLDDKSLAEFKTDPGMALDLLATYTGAGATYVVLRTNLSQGGCGGTDVYVLTVYTEREGQEGPGVEVSPVLQKCMGDVPGICFTYEENEGEIVSVAGYDLRNDTWVAEEGVEEEQK